MPYRHASAVAVSEILEECLFSPELWTNALQAIAQFAGGWGAQLIGFERGGALAFDIATMPKDALGEFERCGGGDLSQNLRARIIAAAPNWVLSDADLASPEEWRRNAFYNDVFVKFDAPHAAVARLAKTGETSVVIAVIRSRNDGNMQNPDREKLQSLLRPLSHAVRRQMNLEAYGAALAVGALEAVSLPAFICDGSGLIEAVTSAGQDELHSGAFLRSRFRRLEATQARSEPLLQGAIHKAAPRQAWNGFPEASTIALHNNTGDRVLCEVAPLPPAKNAMGARGVVVVSLPRQRPLVTAMPSLDNVHGLTAAEVAISRLLVEGAIIADIATSREVSIQTIRNQIKSIFRKLDVSSRAEMTAALLK